MIPVNLSQTKILTKNQSQAVGLACSACGETYSIHQRLNHCTAKDCQQTLLVNYTYQTSLSKEILRSRPFTMWRYKELLPVLDEKNIVSLGEGGTPIIRARKLAKVIGIPELFIKDEGGNPTGSFKARGMSAAVSKAKELGIHKLAIPTAGNAGVALAAYGARAGMEVNVFMPKETPLNHKEEVKLYGANLVELDGNIGDCGKLIAELSDENGWFNVSTLKEPYRLEGKKTMGYELAEQFNWVLPDVILYPTGGGTGLIGFWKAFDELEKLGWIDSRRPRIIAVQSANCDSIVTSFHNQQSHAVAIDKGFTIANGLRVPKSFADQLILKILHSCNGTAISVTDGEIMHSLKEIARMEGLFVAPEGAALWAALKRLRLEGFVNESEKIVMINTGNGNKYSENIFVDGIQ